jgi:molybdopterin biosynthesis enzyme
MTHWQNCSPAPASVGRSVEQVSTFDADGRVLAQDVVSDLQVPPQDNSAMDGYAIARAATSLCRALCCRGQRIAAGASGQPLQPGRRPASSPVRRSRPAPMRW